VIGFLRVVGVVNAAVWFGASFFFTVQVGPAFFSEPMLRLLSRPYAGAAAQVVLERYFWLHQICGGVALLHLAAEWLYMGKAAPRWVIALLGGMLVLSVLGAHGIQPKLQGLHRTIYTAGQLPARRELARRSFRVWHGWSQALNLVLVGGVFVYLLRVTRPPETSRFLP
jgi:hypothetical protein